MKATEVKTKEDYILYLQSVIDEKDKVIENQMNQIKKLLGMLATTENKSEVRSSEEFKRHTRTPIYLLYL